MSLSQARPLATFDERDSAPLMLKCRVIDPAFTWGQVRTPNVPWDRTIVYELHARGYTKLHPEVPEPLRGQNPFWHDAAFGRKGRGPPRPARRSRPAQP